MGHIDKSGSGFYQSWNMCESASPRTLSEVPAQTIDYRVTTTVNSVPTRPVNRWNFRKADWAKFTDRLNTAANKILSPTSEPNTAYKAWCSAILSAAKKTIPRGCRKGLIPTWDEECQQLYDQFTRAEPGAIANVDAVQLSNTLDEKRRQLWESTTASIDFTQSSRQAWQTFNRLTGRAKKTPPCPVSANAIASKLIENGHHRNVDKHVGRDVNGQCGNCNTERKCHNW